MLTISKQTSFAVRTLLLVVTYMYFRTGYHYNKEAVESKFVRVLYCPTAINLIDCGTKALGPMKIESCEPQLHGFEPVCLPDQVDD